jgi:hypothetical protein
MGKRGARVAGVETCGSVWGCPCCAVKIAEGRRADVETVMNAHAAIGGHAYMALFTIPHGEWHFAKSLRDAVARAWRSMTQGKAWKRQMALAGSPGVIRAMEVTHSAANGWHPHLHVLIFTRALSDAERAGMAEWLFDRWSRIVARLGYGACHVGGFGFQLCQHAKAAGDYVAKWGADSELTKWHVKRSRFAGRSPWQLLADAATGDRLAGALWGQFYRAFKGSRHLTWSRGLRELYRLGDELADDALAALEVENCGDYKSLDEPFGGDPVIGRFRRSAWFRIFKAGYVAQVLDAAEAGGWGAVIDFLASVGLSLGRHEHDGNQIAPPGQDQMPQLWRDGARVDLKDWLRRHRMPAGA